MKQTYRVDGMTCGGCVASVTKAIQLRAAAAKVEVDLDKHLVTVEGIDDDALVEDAVEGAGFTYVGRS